MKIDWGTEERQMLDEKVRGKGIERDMMKRDGGRGREKEKQRGRRQKGGAREREGGRERRTDNEREKERESILLLFLF